MYVHIEYGERCLGSWKAGLPVIKMIWELVSRGMAFNMTSNLGMIRIRDSIHQRQSKVSNQNGSGEEYRESASRLSALLFKPQASGQQRRLLDVSKGFQDQWGVKYSQGPSASGGKRVLGGHRVI